MLPPIETPLDAVAAVLCAISVAWIAIMLLRFIYGVFVPVPAWMVEVPEEWR